MNSEKKVVAYQIRKIAISIQWEENEDAHYLFSKGWQLWGSPFIKPDHHGNNGVHQAFVKYEE